MSLIGRSIIVPKLNKFSCVYADPPWMFKDSGTRMAPAYEGEQREEAVYKQMSNDDIIVLGSSIQSISENDCHLWLWCPNALVLDGTASRVIESWGFEAKQLVPWLKTTKNNLAPRIGGGHTTRVCTEMLIVATRGKMITQDRGTAGVLIDNPLDQPLPSLIAPRRGHSEKPDEAYLMIEKVSPESRIELFARKRKDGWVSLGNEIDGKDIRDALKDLQT